ncbi:sugar ABC transporter permease [Paenibacillus sp. SYP-B3998]|uniref:Sugar ABC transporter permease n=1 Tax=Paenibacillus sp. SYP-B3998 TaxID=2678564 RepID=A0A6G3ZW56_9BACL|nr:ABC transporter permease subunit [Paenibacillus sp. SYP-B3998]NEW06278.1 sugar ABC transporter permease [Paenibacillus sp. SYP-B3998]
MVVWKRFKQNKWYLLMVLPVTVWFVLFSYFPMFGTVIAFKQFRIHRDGFFASIANSKWIGFENFKFLFGTQDAYIITRNTLLYNTVFIVLGLVFAVLFAIMLNELGGKKLSKWYQTGMLLPYFISWVVVGYFVFAFLSMDKGLLNRWLELFGVKSIQWYNEPKYWPYILTLTSLWKWIGVNSVIYLASIVGIDKSYYEAAMIDGASKWQQIRNITIPFLTPLMIILTLLAIGRIFYSDFGLFYQVTFDSGPLYATTQVVDTYVFRALRNSGQIGMSAAAGLYQSFVGFILVLFCNYIVKKIDKDQALY